MEKWEMPNIDFNSKETFNSEIKSILNNFKKTIDLMNKYFILPTPENYTIFYSFVEQKDENLIKELNNAINSNNLNETFLNNIYDKYFISNNEKHQILKNIIEKAHKNINETEDNLISLKNSYQFHFDKIQNFTSVFDEQKDLQYQEIIKLFDNILKQHTITISMLHKSNEEIKKLQQEIEKLKYESYIDPLTQIFNRRKFFIEINNRIKNYNEFKDIYIVMMDIDNFKRINDSFNHKIGDGVLKYIAKKVSSCIKGYDIFARYGGEEFILALCCLNSDDSAIKILTEIKNKISETTLKITGTNQVIGKITLSYGMLKFNKSNKIESVIEKADELMYQAKKTGKDKIVFLNSKNQIIEVK